MRSLRLLLLIFTSCAFSTFLFGQTANQVSIFRNTGGTPAAKFMVVNSSDGNQPCQFARCTTADVAHHYLYLLGDGSNVQSTKPVLEIGYTPAATGAARVYSVEGYNNTKPPPDSRIINVADPDPASSFSPSGALSSPPTDSVPTGDWINIRHFYQNIAPAIDDFHVLKIGLQAPANESQTVNVHLFYNFAILHNGTPAEPSVNADFLPANAITYGATITPIDAGPDPELFSYSSRSSWTVQLDGSGADQIIYVELPISSATEMSSSTDPSVIKSVQFLAIVTPAQGVAQMKGARNQSDLSSIISAQLLTDFTITDAVVSNVELVGAHDPNHLLAWTCPCPDTANNKVYFEIQTTNDGSAPQNGVDITFEVPPGLDLSTFQNIYQWIGSAEAPSPIVPSVDPVTRMIKWTLSSVVLKPVSAAPEEKILLRFTLDAVAGFNPKNLPEMEAFIDFGKAGRWSTGKSSVQIFNDSPTSEVGKILACRENCGKCKSMKCPGWWCKYWHCLFGVMALFFLLFVWCWTKRNRVVAILIALVVVYLLWCAYKVWFGS